MGEVCSKLKIKGEFSMSNGIYNNLVAQLDKLYRHNRQGSIKTKERYYEAMKRFCRFLADDYRLEKLSNIASKHMHAYVNHMKDTKLSASTIKTDLSAIRFWHDQIPNPRHKELPDNSAFDLERRSYGKLDRTWSEDEFQKTVIIAADKGRDDYVTALMLAYYAGMRVEECFTIDTSMAEGALRTGEITFHGKNGRWRTVPIEENITKQLKIMLKQVKRGSKLLTPDTVHVRNAIYGFQKFIETHRDTPVTAHGLRHSYACRLYSAGKSLREISQLLGHNRPEVARIYLASVMDGGAGE
jgi:site-specific recombinase XerD